MEGRTDKTAAAPNPSGGGGSSLDLTNERDRGLIRQATKNWPRRWAGLTPEFKDRCAKQLKIAIDEADSLAMTGPEGTAEAAKIRLSVVKTAVAMEGQNQSDEHLAHKTDGDGAEKHKVEVVYVNRPRFGDVGRTDTTARVLPVVDHPALPSPERSGNGDDDGA